MAPKAKRQTKQERLEELAASELPPDLQTKLQAVRNAINDLKTEAQVWGVEKEFSPDGRFLGDVGELIARVFFGVELNVKQEKGHDAKAAEVDGVANTNTGKRVEVKLRSRSTNIEFSTQEEIILVIYVSPSSLKWGVVCNGPGHKLLATAKQTDKGKWATDCHKLFDAQRTVVEADSQLTQIEPKKPTVAK
jgi:hypothetical protein